MNVEEFTKEFVKIFDETELNQLSSDTKFRDLDEWSSLHALATMNIIEQVFGKKINAKTMKEQNTIQDLVDYINS